MVNLKDLEKLCAVSAIRDKLAETQRAYTRRMDSQAAHAAYKTSIKTLRDMVNTTP